MIGQLMGDTVIVAFHFDVVIDVNPGVFPFGVFVGFFGQRF